MAKKLPVALLTALALAQGGLAQQPPTTFSATLTVREREVLVDLPEGIEGGALTPGDFLVLVDGVPREVTRAEPASEWTILLYVDPALAPPATAFYSTLALSRHIRELTRAGTVEIVVADSEPRSVLAATRDEARIRNALAELAGTARVQRDVGDAHPSRSASPSADQIRRQLDKLLVFLTSRRPPGPHAVLLLADGPPSTPEETARLERKEDPQAPPPSIFHRAARLLAAYGWVTFPMPLQNENAGLSIAPQSGLERVRQSAAPSDHQNSLPPIRPNRSPAKTTLSFAGVTDLAVDPRRAALRVLSRASGGTVIGFEPQIGAALADLTRRWRLWIAEPDEPVDGQLHAVEVRLPDQTRIGAMFYPVHLKLPGGARKLARPQAWLRSATPVEITEARLEGGAAGSEAPGGDLPWTASASSAALSLAVAPLPEGPSPPGPLRVSWAFPSGEGLTGHHHLELAVDSLDNGLQQTLPWDPPPGARSVVVVVEALGRERWAGRILPIEPAGP